MPKKLKMMLTCEIKKKSAALNVVIFFVLVGVAWLLYCKGKGIHEYADGCYSWTNSSNAPLLYQNENSALKSFANHKGKVVQQSEWTLNSRFHALPCINPSGAGFLELLARQIVCTHGLTGGLSIWLSWFTWEEVHQFTTGLGGVVVVVGNGQVIAGQSVYNSIQVWMEP